MKWKIRVETEGKTFMVIAHDINVAISLLFFEGEIQGNGGICSKYLEKIIGETPNQFQRII
jgi:hypothetical protein